MICDEPFLDCVEEIVIQASIDEDNDDSRCPIPVSIDINETNTCQQSMAYRQT